LASAVLSTAIRTTSAPESWRSRTWAEVAATSRVEVAVMLWTATGEPLPMVTEPMVTGRVGFRGSCTIGMACRERNVGTPKRCRRVVIGL